jgi:excisionase family DNA binding protein
VKTTDYITLEEAGARLGLSPETIRRYIADGKLAGENLGVRALASDVERYERERRRRGRPSDPTREEVLTALCDELTDRGIRYRASDVFGFLGACWPTDSTVEELADDWEQSTKA